MIGARIWPNLDVEVFTSFSKFIQKYEHGFDQISINLDLQITYILRRLNRTFSIINVLVKL
jgi:hypothetical protein